MENNGIIQYAFSKEIDAFFEATLVEFEEAAARRDRKEDPKGNIIGWDDEIGDYVYETEESDDEEIEEAVLLSERINAKELTKEESLNFKLVDETDGNYNFVIDDIREELIENFNNEFGCQEMPDKICEFYENQNFARLIDTYDLKEFHDFRKDLGGLFALLDDTAPAADYQVVQVSRDVWDRLSPPERKQVEESFKPKFGALDLDYNKINLTLIGEEREYVEANITFREDQMGTRRMVMEKNDAILHEDIFNKSLNLLTAVFPEYTMKAALEFLRMTLFPTRGSETFYKKIAQRYNLNRTLFSYLQCDKEIKIPKNIPETTDFKGLFLSRDDIFMSPMEAFYGLKYIKTNDLHLKPKSGSTFLIHGKELNEVFETIKQNSYKDSIEYNCDICFLKGMNVEHVSGTFYCDPFIKCKVVNYRKKVTRSYYHKVYIVEEILGTMEYSNRYVEIMDDSSYIANENLRFIAYDSGPYGRTLRTRFVAHYKNFTVMMWLIGDFNESYKSFQMAIARIMYSTRLINIKDTYVLRKKMD